VVNAGTIVANASNTFNTTSSMTLATSTTLNLNSTSQTINALTANNAAIDFGTNGSLTLTGANSITGTFAGSGTITLGPGASLTLNSSFNNPNINFVLAGGTLNLNGTAGSVTDTFGTMNVTGNSVLDFGLNTAATLNVSTFSIANTKTLSITNWVNTVDYFYAQNWAAGTTPPALNSRGQGDALQVTFGNYTNSSTAWLDYGASGRQITPAPEPATYGAIFVGLTLGAVGFRRYRRSRSAA
jgi:hypothetical protein